MAQEITTISTHVEDALARLLERYKGKEKTEGIIEALADQFQDLEDVTFSLILGRAISTAEGKQLDLLGTIVDLERESGLSDERYRVLLYVKIGQNTSQGAPEKLITVLKLLAEADVVFYQNLTRASVLLAADRDLDPSSDPDDVIFLYENLQKVAAAGIRIDYLVSFSENDDSFACAGSNADAAALGFGNTLDANAGGKFARIHRQLIPFAFDGQSVDRRGFGTVRDPLVGGTLVTT